MNKNSRSSTLLIEMLIVILFFMISCTVLVQVYAGARTLSARSGERSRALAEAQRIAEQMTASGEITLPEEAEGFVFDGTGWEKQVGKVVIRVEAGSSDTAAGRMREGFIRLTDGDELLTELDLALYLPGEVER